ncbi:Tyrosine-protein kinase, active site [Sesbania bispinosa]|nr:Tyrosine-protein kinase, active site [Sesbania bispinosa]
MEILCLLHLLLAWYVSNCELVGAEFQDQAILLAINQELRVPGWGEANNTNYCTWQGVSCGNHSMVEKLDLAHKNLRGNVSLMSELKALKRLDLSNNNFDGLIPPAFGNLSDLEVLDLSSNKFEGSIPPQLDGLKNLKSLNLSNNVLVGEIPMELQGLEKLQDLQISSNHLSGFIPSWVGNLTNLRVFTAYENRLGGRIPDNLGLIPDLQILNLHSNQLEGPIPASIFASGKLEVLIALNLSFNHLHGPLPPELGKLDKLVSLDVSNNRLSGNIPAELKGMLSLIEVNFSNNQFGGPVPTFVPFQKSPSSSFLGNKGLCGEPLNSTCGDLYDDHKSYHHRVSYRIILAVIGSGLAVFMSVTVVVLLFMLRERQEKVAKDAGIVDDAINDKPTIIAGSIFVDNLKQAVDLDAVVKATLKDSNKLSSGTFSTVYKAIMPSGVVLSVRRLKSIDKAIIHHQNKMIRELERLGKVCHDNLVRPIGYVIYEDVALLLHNYFPNGTLAQLLHESTRQPEYQPDWPGRLSIAIGVAEGLAFLHHVAIIHLDISSGNVLLDANFKPLVGEIEISKLLDPTKGTASISAVAGSFGYIPPEYAYTMQVTAPGNVYSYGVVLLEILTTRQPVDEDFGEGVDLVKWVHSAPVRGETPEQILDARLSTVSFGWRKEMLAALKVALLCTDNTPAKRPKMKNVVEMLREIKQN